MSSMKEALHKAGLRSTMEMEEETLRLVEERKAREKAKAEAKRRAKVMAKLRGYDPKVAHGEAVPAVVQYQQVHTKSEIEGIDY